MRPAQSKNGGADQLPNRGRARSAVIAARRLNKAAFASDLRPFGFLPETPSLAQEPQWRGAGAAAVLLGVTKTT